MGLKALLLPAHPPVLQETVHVQVGKHGADNPTLRSSASILAPPAQSPVSLLVPLLDRDFQPHLQQMQHVSIDDSSGNALKQFPMRNFVEGTYDTLPIISTSQKK